MDPNHCLKSRVIPAEPAMLGCSRLFKNSSLGLWESLFSMAVQRLDIKRPGHWPVLKVQFCLVMTVLFKNGPPVIIKNRGF